MFSNRANEILNKINCEDKKYYSQLVNDAYGNNVIYVNNNEHDGLKWFIEFSHADEQTVLIATTMELIERAGTAHLLKISFREVESYLRDNPGVIAWEGIYSLKKWYTQFLEILLCDILEKELYKNEVLVRNWGQMALRDKIDHIANTMEKVNQALQHIYAIELTFVALEEDELYFIPAPSLSEMVLTSIFKTLHQYLAHALSYPQIKLVAQ